MDEFIQQSDLLKLPFQSLTEHKQQLEQDTNFLQDSLNTLRMAQEKFEYSKKNVEKLIKLKDNYRKNNTLVPLTESIFVRGEIMDMDKFMVNVGTGYYLNMGDKKTLNYFKRRVDYVSGQMDAIQKFLTEKEFAKNLITAVIEEKIQLEGGTPVTEEKQDDEDNDNDNEDDEDLEYALRNVQFEKAKGSNDNE